MGSNFACLLKVKIDFVEAVMGRHAIGWSVVVASVVFVMTLAVSVSLFLRPWPAKVLEKTSDTTPISEYEVGSFSRTAIVPTLDSPIPDNQNCTWSASIQCAWNELKKEIGGDVQVESSSATVKKLNDSDFAPKNVAASDLDISISKMGPAFEITAEIRLSVPFKYQFFDAVKPVKFQSGDQKECSIAMFGIRESEMYSTQDYRSQVDLLWDSFKYNGEFAVDLCRHTDPYQLVLVRMARQKSLADAIQYHGTKMKTSVMGKLHDEDMLLVPRMAFRMQQAFPELDDQILTNPKFRGMELSTKNDIQWTLNKAGAKALASTKIAVLNGGPRLLSFDHPFLILVLNRRTKETILALWIDNDELLSPFNEE